MKDVNIKAIVNDNPNKKQICRVRAEYYLICLLSILAIFIFIPTSYAAEQKAAILPINHVTASSFSKDGDYYNPNGRILFSVNKREYQTIQTLDELLVSSSNKAGKITIGLVGENGPVSMMSYSVSNNDRYLHYNTTWNISNKPSGNYMFIILADDEYVAKYMLEING